jgi:predicted RNA binding protein YcfA (HicA-like mRNA interferase family)
LNFRFQANHDNHGKISVDNKKSLTLPKKIRELKTMLLKAGFTYRSGKGSHTVWSHILLPYSLTLSGKDGADADRYQEKDVKNALRDLENLEEEEDKGE